MAGPNPPPGRPADQATEKSDDIVIASVDHRIPAEDAVAPRLARLLGEDTAPLPLATPAPFGTAFEFDENGFVVATKDGAVTPDGVIVFAGQPVKVPAKNPQIIAIAVQPNPAAAPDERALTLSRLNLIGVYGSPSDRLALLRLPSGRYVKVKVGDQIDGGLVAQIGAGELQYVKDGRTVTLAMPRG